MKDLQNSESFPAGRDGQMSQAKIERKILAVIMESPFYFTIPLQRRLEFLKFFSQRSVCNRIFEHNPQLLSPEADTQPRDKKEYE
jgi:hypothetical protein